MQIEWLCVRGGSRPEPPYFRGGEGVGFRDYPQAGVAEVQADCLHLLPIFLVFLRNRGALVGLWGLTGAP